MSNKGEVENITLLFYVAGLQPLLPYTHLLFSLNQNLHSSKQVDIKLESTYQI